jgi:hypothetical protein
MSYDVSARWRHIMRGRQYLWLVLVLGLLAAGLWQFYALASRQQATTQADELWQAVGEMDTATAHEILESNPKYIHASDKHGRTLLFHAVQQGRDDDEALQMARMLIEFGADVDAADNSGTCPLHVAARKGLPNITRQLLAVGADARKPDHAGRRPLDVAEEFRLDQLADIGKRDRLRDRRTAVADILKAHQQEQELLD